MVLFVIPTKVGIQMSFFVSTTNALSKVSLQGVKRKSNPLFISEIATLPLVARNDNVIAFNAFVSIVLSVTNLYIIFLVIPVKTGIQWLWFWIPASAGMTFKIKVFMGQHTGFPLSR